MHPWAQAGHRPTEGTVPCPVGGPGAPWSSDREACPPGNFFPCLLQPVDGVALQRGEDGIERREILERPALLARGERGREAGLELLPAPASAPQQTRQMPGEPPRGPGPRE